MTEKKWNEQQLYVQKEPFEYNGKTYNHYYIKGKVRGREVKIELAPPNKDTDMGGYTVLDIVFGEEDIAELIVEPFEMEDEKSKRVITGNRYFVRTVDEDGKLGCGRKGSCRHHQHRFLRRTAACFAALHLGRNDCGEVVSRLSVVLYGLAVQARG